MTKKIEDAQPIIYPIPVLHSPISQANMIYTLTEKINELCEVVNVLREETIKLKQK